MTDEARKLFTVAIAESLEGDAFQQAVEALAQYFHHNERIRQQGVRLSEYLASALMDIGQPMPDELRKRLDAEQHRFGGIVDGLTVKV